MKRLDCKFCRVSFNNLNSSERANHTRWCSNNPARERYSKDLSKARAGITADSRVKQKIGISKAHADGRYEHCDRKTFLGKTHSEHSKQLIREKALASPHRRLRKGVVEYNGILLDSSWELELAKRLDQLQIKWIRPKPIPWVDEDGIAHNYFSDFYLLDYDLYLDPKNPHAIKVQQKKLSRILTQYKNIIIIDSLDGCKNFKL